MANTLCIPQKSLFRLTEPSRLYLRILLTRQCNSSCAFCFREGGKGSDGKLFSADFFQVIVRVAEKYAIPKIHFTGGEPLLDKQVSEYIRQVAAHQSVEVGLTTNGIILHAEASKLYAAGLRRINVSIPSLRPVRYRAICGQDMLQTVLSNIDLALKEGFSPIKINIPVYRDNVDEMQDFMEYFLKKNGVILRFFSILSNNGIPDSAYLTVEEATGYLEEAICRLAGKLREEAMKRVFYRPPFESRSSICSTCTKRDYCRDQAKAIRISSDGNISLCLSNPEYSTYVERLSDIDHAVSQLLLQYYC
jgi:cyclic pyranopterin phosphate synthase